MERKQSWQGGLQAFSHATRTASGGNKDGIIAPGTSNHVNNSAARDEGGGASFGQYINSLASAPAVPAHCLLR